METEHRYRPVLMIVPGSMSKRDIGRMERKGGIIVVECSEPETATFADPPAHRTMDDQARASMALFRWLSIKGTSFNTNNGDAIQFWVRALIEGKQPEAAPNARKAKP